MLIIHKRKKSLQDSDKPGQIFIPKIENNYSRYNQNNAKHYSLNKITINTEGNNKNNIQKENLRLKSPQMHRQEITKKYTSNTFSRFHIQNNSEENLQKKKNDTVFPKIKGSLKNQYNLSEMNISNYGSKHNNLKSIQNNKKNNNTIQKNLRTENENNSKSELNNSLNEEYNSQRTNNHQIKSTKITKIQILQKEKSQGKLNNRLLIQSAGPQLKSSNNTTKKNSTDNLKYSLNNNNNSNKKEEVKNDYNNHILYDSINIKKNKNTKKSNNSLNNLNTNYSNANLRSSTSTSSSTSSSSSTVHRSYSKPKSEEREREKSKEKKQEKTKTEYKSRTYVKSKPSEIKVDDDEEEFDKILIDLENIANSFSSTQMDINPVETFGQKKDPIFLSPGILTSIHSKFKPSFFSSENEFNKNDLIQAYAYNSNEGNIRDYNEDTITATKIFLDPKDKNNYFHFFAVYDGHGGKGCSLYLKNNLHKYIKELSAKGIKNAVNEVENNFLEKVALVNGVLSDISGSCAIMVLLKNKKCIIANIGDSRCVLFRNKRLFFSTRDHKPNSSFEKRRIEQAGGSIYQTQSVIPLYQNGKLIEIPWRVQPGGLSVSRTFGDIESKEAKYGGKKGVVVALPDVVEFDLNDEYNFMVIGCDGIFDVLSNNEIMECIKIVLRINKTKNKKINELCGDFAAMIIKSALAKESFDNVSCIVVVFNIKGLI